MQSNFYRYHFGLEWEKRKFVRKVHAKRILQTAPHTGGYICKETNFIFSFSLELVQFFLFAECAGGPRPVGSCCKARLVFFLVK